MENRLDEMAARLGEKALKAGAEAAEGLARFSNSIRIEVKDGCLEGVRRTREVAAVLRVIIGGRPGFSYSTGPTVEDEEEMVRTALAAAELAAPGEDNRFSEAASPGRVQGILDDVGAALPFCEKVNLALALESAAFSADDSIGKVHKPAFTEHRRTTSIASGGEVWTYSDTTFTMSIQAVAEAGGESQTGFDYRASRRLSDLDPRGIGEKAARDAAGLLGGTPPATGCYPALFPPWTAVDLLGILAASFSADEMQKGRSRLAGRFGERVFSPIMNIKDDGSLPWLTGSVPFDDERVPPMPRNIVDKGSMTGCLHSIRTAAKWGEKPTGNGFRASLRTVPSPGGTNLYIVPGPSPVAGRLPPGRVLQVEALMGVHTADRVSGDFSFGAAGYFLENGEKSVPFRNGTVSGNIFNLFNGIDALGNDLIFYGSMGSPTLLAGSVIVSGR